MSGFSLADLHENIVRSLRGRCLQTEAGLIAKNGDRHEHCGTCLTRCGGEDLGLSSGVEVGRAWGSGALELRWACPSCSREVTQETTALASLADAEETKRDPLCYACRMTANVGGEARLAAPRPSQTTNATPQGVASTDQLGGRVRSEKD